MGSQLSYFGYDEYNDDNDIEFVEYECVSNHNCDTENTVDFSGENESYNNTNTDKNNDIQQLISMPPGLFVSNELQSSNNLIDNTIENNNILSDNSTFEITTVPIVNSNHDDIVNDNNSDNDNNNNDCNANDNVNANANANANYNVIQPSLLCSSKYELICKSEFGKIYLVTDSNTNEQYIEKQIDIITNDDTVFEQPRYGKYHKVINSQNNISEWIALEKCAVHPNIAKMYWFKENLIPNVHHSVQLFMKYYKYGDLFDYMQSVSLSEMQIACIVKQLLLALRYCHRIGISHGDVKLENILVSSVNPIRISLSDFGFAKTFNLNKRELIEINVGTHLYLPPEVVTYKQGYPPLCDAWAVGITLYTLLTDTYPFSPPENDNRKTDSKTFSSYPKLILNSDLPEATLGPNLELLLNNNNTTKTEQHVYKNTSRDNDLNDAELKHLINSIKHDAITFDENEKRLSQNARNVINGLLTKDANKRFTIQTALKSPWFKKITQFYLNDN